MGMSEWRMRVLLGLVGAGALCAGTEPMVSPLVDSAADSADAATHAEHSASATLVDPRSLDGVVAHSAMGANARILYRLIGPQGVPPSATAGRRTVAPAPEVESGFFVCRRGDSYSKILSVGPSGGSVGTLTMFDRYEVERPVSLSVDPGVVFRIDPGRPPQKP